MQYTEKANEMDSHSVLASTVPHQIRGFLRDWRQLCITAPAYDRCVACSSPVVKQYREGGWEWIEKMLKEPREIEKVVGLDKMKLETELANVDWEADSEGDDSNSNVV